MTMVADDDSVRAPRARRSRCSAVAVATLRYHNFGSDGFSARAYLDGSRLRSPPRRSLYERAVRPRTAPHPALGGAAYLRRFVPRRLTRPATGQLVSAATGHGPPA